ncbi:unnamed protein product [Anisakis simplex]|uniref:Asparagine synthetase domain-containing protein n=1 Tax=Anisakis simplex TaxID=6269 RepID=A0A3P6NSH3_ANISI|nr:unnamed protein product [Anisakis simplex]
MKLNSNGNILSNATIYTAIESDGEQPLWIQQFADLEIVLLSDIMANVLVTSKDPPKNEPNESELDEISDEMVQRLNASIMRNLDDMTTFVHETHPSVTLLFSGGVDSLLLAHLLHKCIDPSMCIDLINVSFDQNSKWVRKRDSCILLIANNILQDFSGAPDRVRGIEAYEHLRECYPSREFRLILVNVDRDELADCRRRHIARLVRPSETVLDDSIACVLWFAARAEGVLYANTTMPPESLKHSSNSQVDRVKSESKVVIVGSGADELFGGYSRHRGCYENAGRLAAIDEMQRELIRIGERNLGRDDRIISAHSKDVRAPYLDDLFVEWVNCLPLELKSDFTKIRGVGEKALIRRALKHFGAPRTLFAAPKRAMQFGTRIAKLEERKEKGSDRCSRLVVNDSDAILVGNIANTN